MTPEQQTALENLEGLLGAEGVALYDHVAKPEIESQISVLAPEVVGAVVNAVNAKLTDGGLTGLVESKIKKADVAAEGTLTASAEAALDAFLDTLDTIATRALAGLTGGAPAT